MPNDNPVDLTPAMREVIERSHYWEYPEVHDWAHPLTVTSWLAKELGLPHEGRDADRDSSRTFTLLALFRKLQGAIEQGRPPDPTQMIEQVVMGRDWRLSDLVDELHWADYRSCAPDSS